MSLIILILWLPPAAYGFNYICGCLFQDQVVLAVDTQNRLNQPPIISYPTGDPPLNVSMTVTTGALPDGEPLTVYQYWYEWCAPAGTCPLHPAPDWEPVYVYWKVTNPLQPVLLAVWDRFHFVWTQTGGSAVSLNGTQVIVSFGVDLGATRWHVPAIRGLSWLSLFKPGNMTLSIPQGTSPGFGVNQWSYPVSNGGPHPVQVMVDPNSPYCCYYGNPPPPGYTNNPYGYENDQNGYAGPADPLSLYGTGHNIQTGLLVGGVIIVLGWFLTIALIFEARLIGRVLRRLRL